MTIATSLAACGCVAQPKPFNPAEHWPRLVLQENELEVQDDANEPCIMLWEERVGEICCVEGVDKWFDLYMVVWPSGRVVCLDEQQRRECAVPPETVREALSNILSTRASISKFSVFTRHIPEVWTCSNGLRQITVMPEADDWDRFQMPDGPDRDQQRARIDECLGRLRAMCIR